MYSKSSKYLIDPLSLFGDLPILKLKVEATIKEQNNLPYFLSSTWRGVIGNSLQNLVCPFKKKNKNCASCAIREYCPYFQLVELDSDINGFHSTVRGYVLFSLLTNRDKLWLEITLFGRASKFVNALILALIEAQKIGLGYRRMPFVLSSIVELLPSGRKNILSLDCDKLNIKGPFSLREWIENFSIAIVEKIYFVTPLRLRKQGRYLFKMDWPFFFSTLARRLEMLRVFFGGGERLSKDEWYKLKSIFENEAKVDREDLIWKDLKRYSNRQKRKVPLGGLIGTIYISEISPWWWKWWQMAHFVYVGKGASMGLGRIIF